MNVTDLLLKKYNIFFYEDNEIFVKNFYKFIVKAFFFLKFIFFLLIKYFLQFKYFLFKKQHSGLDPAQRLTGSRPGLPALQPNP